jgi:hypothetical protein
VARLTANGKWWQLAACRSADPDLFFPISLPGPALVSRVRAADQQVHGISGGRTKEERHQAAKTSQGT